MGLLLSSHPAKRIKHVSFIELIVSIYSMLLLTIRKEAGFENATAVASAASSTSS